MAGAGGVNRGEIVSQLRTKVDELSKSSDMGEVEEKLEFIGTILSQLATVDSTEQVTSLQTRVGLLQTMGSASTLTEVASVANAILMYLSTEGGRGEAVEGVEDWELVERSESTGGIGAAAGEAVEVGGEEEWVEVSGPSEEMVHFQDAIKALVECYRAIEAKANREKTSAKSRVLDHFQRKLTFGGFRLRAPERRWNSSYDSANTGLHYGQFFLSGKDFDEHILNRLQEKLDKTFSEGALVGRAVPEDAQRELDTYFDAMSNDFYAANADLLSAAASNVPVEMPESSQVEALVVEEQRLIGEMKRAVGHFWKASIEAGILLNVKNQTLEQMGPLNFSVRADAEFRIERKRAMLNDQINQAMQTFNECSEALSALLG